MNKGSSETTREAFDFDLFWKHRPEHKTRIEKRFLEWFVGFVEGDGSFLMWHDGKTLRAGFILDQEDPKVIKRLRTALGFGTVSEITKKEKKSLFYHGGVRYEERTYWRYAVYDKKGLMHLFFIFYGNIVLEQRHLQFQKWTTYLPFTPVIPEKHVKRAVTNQQSGDYLINLDNGWLSGFWQANGGFYPWGCIDKELTQGKKPHIILRMYLIQQAELPILNRISMILENKLKKIQQITNGKTQTQYNRLEFASKPTLQLLFNYFKIFPLQGQKHLTLLQFRRIFDRRERILNGEVLPEKSIAKLKKDIELGKKANQKQLTKSIIK